MRNNELLVPPSVAPGYGDPHDPVVGLDHLLFALKHEGVNLQVLSEMMSHITADSLSQAVYRKPNSAPLRIAAYLWEHFTGNQLDDAPEIVASTVPLFDPDRYIVSSASQKDSRWRVAFNGLGTMDYCVTVERTKDIQRLLDEDILMQTRIFFKNTDQRIMDRAIAWAYLSETESSFAIERETVPYNKAEAFVMLLRKAFDAHPCNEDYLVHLQNAVITNPLDRAVAFRHTQNWLQNGLRGASGISYLPPPPEMLQQIMPHIIRMANTLHTQVNPLVAASVVSFAFVFAHPFMDGNGRLSRFLFHRTLAQSGKLEADTVLPVSMAMKRHEREYLKALQSFSVPARGMWNVRWLDGDQFDFRLSGNGTIYRYWDATPVVAFGLDMAKEALRHDLQSEVKLLSIYDAMIHRMEREYDIRNSDLSILALSCIQNGGIVSNNRRKQFHATVPEPAFAALEAAWRECSLSVGLSPPDGCRQHTSGDTVELSPDALRETPQEQGNPWVQSTPPPKPAEQAKKAPEPPAGEQPPRQSWGSGPS
uniref:Filamentation induced by cAMP protein Fic n=1 Tax=mine drainage metagenome TaxID=410659 RepID=E6QJD6_9ZZZZ